MIVILIHAYTLSLFIIKLFFFYNLTISKNIISIYFLKYNFIKIKGESPTKKEEGEPIKVPDYVKQFKEIFAF